MNRPVVVNSDGQNTVQRAISVARPQANEMQRQLVGMDPAGAFHFSHRLLDPMIYKPVLAGFTGEKALFDVESYPNYILFTFENIQTGIIARFRIDADTGVDTHGTESLCAEARCIHHLQRPRFRQSCVGRRDQRRCH